jgi:hypothetical protein
LFLKKKVVDKKQLEKEKSVHKFLTEDIFQEMYQDLNAFPDVKDVIEQREWIPVNRVADLRINDIVRPGYDLSGTWMMGFTFFWWTRKTGFLLNMLFGS